MTISDAYAFCLFRLVILIVAFWSRETLIIFIPSITVLDSLWFFIKFNLRRDELVELDDVEFALLSLFEEADKAEKLYRVTLKV